MKIVILSLDNSEKIVVGGKHIHQMLFKKGLLALGHDVKMLFPKRTWPYLLARLILTVCSALRISGKDKIFSLVLSSYCSSLRRQLECEKPSLVIVQDPVSACACDILKGNTAVFMTLHGYLGRESVNYGSYSEKEKEKVLKTALKYEVDAFNVIQGVACVDSKIQAYIKDELKCETPMMMLENAVDPEIFGLTSEQVLLGLRQEMNISGSAKVVLVPRRLVRKNGVDIALRACALLKKRISKGGLVFIVLGDGPERSSLQELKSHLELTDREVLFLGSVPHDLIATYYDMADIVVVPSVIRDGVEEATSLSMLEGMAAKKIVVVSAIGGMKDVVRTGENGFSFPQGDGESLADLIVRVLEMPEPEKGLIRSQAYQDVMERHHYIAHAKAYMDFVEVTQRVT